MPDPTHTAHDAPVIWIYQRRVRGLAIISLLAAVAFLVATLHRRGSAPDNIAEPIILPELRRGLDQSRARHGERLDTGEASPEQRAILTEAWLSEIAHLQKSSAQKRQRHASGKPETAVQAAIPHSPIPPEATPLQHDIIGMENEILDFQNSLVAFLAINKESLSELAVMKRRHSTEFHGLPPENQAPSAPSTADTPTRVLPTSVSSAKLRRIQTEASKLNPEARAVYLESELDTISRLQHEMSSARSLEISSETIPTNTHPTSK